MKRCPTSRFTVAMIATALCALFAVSAFAQFQTGNIYGKVQAKDGSVLPGVTVTLAGPGATQSFVTDAQGSFRYLNLSPGTYTIKAELAGYGTATRAGVGVSVGRSSDVTLTLNPSVSESITVTAEAPLLDVRKAGTGINVPKVELEKIPTSRDPWTILQSAPAVQVDRINVGGSQSGQQSVYHAKGATAADNTWNVDGVNITDMGATGSTPLYFDFDSFEEMQITTGGSDPRVMTPGVQLNMVTKRGTNDIRGSSRYFYTPGSYQADAKVPGEATGYLSQTNSINYVRDYGAEVGGAVWKDHLWLWVADSENKISNRASVNNLGGGGALDNIILRDKNAKINGQLTASNSAVGFYTFGDKVRNARSLSSTRPFEAAWRQTGPTKVYKIEDTQIFGSSLYLTGMWSKVSGGFSLIPNGGGSQSASGPNAYADASSVWHNSYLFYITERPQKQYSLDGSKFFDMGSMNHELKFGFGYRNTPITSNSGWPGATQGYWHFDAGTDCAGAGLPNVNCGTAVLTRNRDAAYGEKYNNFYVGDTILMGNLTVQAGLRWDRQKSLNQPSTAAANPLIGTPITLPSLFSPGNFTISLPTLNFPGDSKELSWSTVSPRIGLTYALGADKKTLLRAGYNRYVSQMGSTINGASPLGYVSYAYFYGNDINNDKIIQRNELLAVQGYYYFDAAHPASATSPVRVNYGMKPPHSDELLFGFERELMSDFSVGANFTYRKYNDLVSRVSEKTQGAGNFYTPADYMPYTKGQNNPLIVGGTYNQTVAGSTVNSFTLPSVTVYQLKPGVPRPVYSVITNRPDYSQKFQGLELTATKRLSHNWMLRGNISYNDWTESCGALAAPDPTPTLGSCPGGQVVERSAGSGAFGNVFINSKWSYNVTGLYQLPWDFNLGASLTGRQGYPSPFRASVSGAPEGTKQVVFGQIGDTRFSNVYELDLRAAKDFRFFNRVGITISADLFNAPNKRTILQRETLLLRYAPSSSLTTTNPTGRSNNAAGNRITEMQSPRVWRFGAKITF